MRYIFLVAVDHIDNSRETDQKAILIAQARESEDLSKLRDCRIQMKRTDGRNILKEDQQAYFKKEGEEESSFSDSQILNLGTDAIKQVRERKKRNQFRNQVRRYL